jgi:hypothetical protein
MRGNHCLGPGPEALLIMIAHAVMLRTKEFSCGGVGGESLRPCLEINLVPVYGRDLTGRKAVNVASVHV